MNDFRFDQLSGSACGAVSTTDGSRMVDHHDPEPVPGPAPDAKADAPKAEEKPKAEWVPIPKSGQLAGQEIKYRGFSPQ